MSEQFVQKFLRSADKISMNGQLLSNDAFDFAKCLHILHQKQGYSGITLDFSQAYPVREPFMVPALAIIRDYRRQGVDFHLKLPENPSGQSLFHNANWSYLIDDANYEPTTFEGSSHLPASVYQTSNEQTTVVDRIMSMILKIIPLQRKQLTALEWSINEISDNVLNHSQSKVGGIIQASTITVGGKTMVEFVVADAGIGIMRSLNEKNNVRALERAIQEGVTRNPRTNQGNGLYGTFRVATLSNGKFEIHSGKASLVAGGTDKVRTSNRESTFLPGTFVCCRIGCDDEKLIENALTFKGKVHHPGFDYIEKQYEAGEKQFAFKMRDECNSVGSREAGITTRTLIENLLRSEPTYKLTIDFEGISIISSSFADEVFGRLFVALGPMAFMSRIEFRHLDASVRAVLDRSISLRVTQALAKN